MSTAVPGKPIRKAANISTTPNATKPGNNNSVMPNKKVATPFGGVDKSVYVRKSSGITPGGQPINDTDAGRGTGNARGGSRKSANMNGVD